MADKTASGSGGSSAQDSSKKVGLIGLVGIVISAMIGGGIYNLPQNMAADASAGAIIIAWVVTGIGIWFIANTTRAHERPVHVRRKGLRQADRLLRGVRLLDLQLLRACCLLSARHGHAELLRARLHGRQ